MSFSGLRVLSLESRRAKEMEVLILRQGGVAFVAPSVKERAVDDAADAVNFVEQFEAGAFEMLICMTGAGITFWRDILNPTVSPERLGAALRRATIISRGPKPVGILRTLGVPVSVIIPEPNTWKEIVTAVAARPERKIAVQEYGRPNLEMSQALEQLGAKVTPIALYRWELPDDLEPLCEAAHRLARREIDVVLFTSSIQLDHLLQIANEEGVGAEVQRALRNDVAIASVGPVMTSTLEANGTPPDIIPNHPKMASLVKAAAERAAEILSRKRAR